MHRYNIIKTTYDKHTARIMLNIEKIKTFSLRSRIRQECQFSLLLFNIVLNIRNRIKDMQIGRKKVKKSLSLVNIYYM